MIEEISAVFLWILVILSEAPGLAGSPGAYTRKGKKSSAQVIPTKKPPDPEGESGFWLVGW